MKCSICFENNAQYYCSDCNHTLVCGGVDCHIGNDLPKEITIEILLNLNYNDLNNACKSSIEIARVCSDPAFKRKYMDKNIDYFRQEFYRRLRGMMMDTKSLKLVNRWFQYFEPYISTAILQKFLMYLMGAYQYNRVPLKMPLLHLINNEQLWDTDDFRYLRTIEANYKYMMRFSANKDISDAFYNHFDKVTTRK